MTLLSPVPKGSSNGPATISPLGVGRYFAVGKIYPSKMSSLERKMEVDKPLQHPENISLPKEMCVCVEYEVGPAAELCSVPVLP